MCGIAGYVDFTARTNRETILHMIEELRHRGPDDMGYEHKYYPHSCVGMGQCRLSIIDLSPAGRQPMRHEKLTIIFNGEIYNYRELRKSLEKEGHKFESHSDTEVILHCYEKWGPEFVKKLIGMFVIVLMDEQINELFIFRDRGGVKPLFYYWDSYQLIFASELKALFAHPSFRKEIDMSALSLYFDFGYIPAPYSIFKNTYKLEAGHYLALNINDGDFSIVRYWSIDEYYRKEKFKCSFFEAKEQLLEIIKSACNYRLVADVPVGVFLSGGYDSSLVTAVLQRERRERLKTFTIGFEVGNNEAPHAKRIAEFLGTDHTEYVCTVKETQDIITDLAYFYDEPFADSSAIPTILVSRVARNSVKVALSADAGDELFAGYVSYEKIARIIRYLNLLPRHLIQFINPSLKYIIGILPLNVELKHKLESVVYSANEDQVKQLLRLGRFASSLPRLYEENLFLSSINKYSTIYDNDFSGFSSPLEIFLAIDYELYLQNDILTKVDRASMSVSLESREPLVDHRLAEFAAQLPLDYKYSGKGGKIILKDIAHDYMPKDLLNRRKLGFTLPIYEWLRGDLSYLIDEYLNERSLRETGFFNASFVLQIVKQFRMNKLYYKPLIWKLLIFQMWYFKWIK